MNPKVHQHNLYQESPAQMKEPEKWNLQNLPPEGHHDVGPYFYQLYEEALTERDRLGLPERWMENYRLYRGDHWQGILRMFEQAKMGKSRLSLALLQANITRTVANITSRSPVAEVVSADGIEDQSDRLLSEKMRVWSAMAEQQRSLSRSVLGQEIYGITVEKAIYDHHKRQGQSIVLDPFSFLPAPGTYDTLNDAPYLIHIFALPVEMVEDIYDVEGVKPTEEVKTVLGEDRENERVPVNTSIYTMNAVGNYVATNHPTSPDDLKTRRALCVEIWIRDHSTKKGEEVVVEMDEQGNPVETVVEVEKPIYPGGIRVVTFTNYGRILLADQRNPNVNYGLPSHIAERTYLHDHFPFYHSNSYEDPTSLYGFSMAETVGDINLAIDELWSTIMAYMKMAMFPPLILPKDAKIPTSKIRYLPRLILQPISGSTGSNIKWLEMPTPPQWLFNSLDTLISFFDRISQIEDADRGSSPGGVTSASGVQMLQERSAVLIQAKIRAVDYLIRERGRCFISFFQNFGIHEEMVSLNGEMTPMVGISLADRKFNYVVESGSTIAKTSSQVRAEAIELYKLQAIDRRALLEMIAFPDWQKVVERMGESDLQAAMSVLVQSGLDENMARELYNYLTQDQGGPGDVTRQNLPGGGVGKPGAPAEAGIPKAMQGAPAEGAA